MTRARDVADAGHATTATTADTISQKTSINLSGTYSTHQLLVADAYNFAGDLTVNDNLILGKISDDGNDLVLEGSHTLQGTGQLEAGYISSSGIGSVDGMTGTLGSGITLGSGVTGTLGNGVTLPSAATQGLGVGQYWTNVTGIRSKNTTYTNSTGLPIFISIIAMTGTGGDIKMRIGGSTPPASVYTNSSNGRNEISAIVPDGQTYHLITAGAATPHAWMELR